MPFQNYVPWNNAQGQLIAGISAGAGTMILQTGQGGRFPTTFPFLCEIKNVDTVAPYAVLKREIVKVTGRTGDTCTITRSAGTCLPNDTSNTPGTTAYSFSTGDIVTLTVTAETIKDIQDEVARLETAKLNLSGGILTGLLQGAKSTNIASASTTNLATLTGNFAHVTGTTTINAFGTVTAGTQICLVFDGILTLTYNATSMILPTAANITTAAGDAAIFESEGSGNWKCIAYTRANGTALASTSDDFVLTNKIGYIWDTVVAKMLPTTTSAMIGWTNTAMTFTKDAGGRAAVTSTTANTALSTNLPGTGSTDTYSLAGGKDLVVTWELRLSVTTGRTGWGLQQTDTAIHDIQTGTFNGARFIQNGGTLYTHTSNGTSQTNNTIGGITLTNYNVYRIEVDPGVSVKFYVNGTLVSTHTTNLPVTGQVLVYGSNNSGTVGHMLDPIISRQV